MGWDFRVKMVGVWEVWHQAGSSLWGGSVRVHVCWDGQGHVGRVRMSQDGSEWGIL